MIEIVPWMMIDPADGTAVAAIQKSLRLMPNVTKCIVTATRVEAPAVTMYRQLREEFEDLEIVPGLLTSGFSGPGWTKERVPGHGLISQRCRAFSDAVYRHGDRRSICLDFELTRNRFKNQSTRMEYSGRPDEFAEVWETDQWHDVYVYPQALDISNEGEEAWHNELLEYCSVLGEEKTIMLDLAENGPGFDQSETRQRAYRELAGEYGARTMPKLNVQMVGFDNRYYKPTDLLWMLPTLRWRRPQRYRETIIWSIGRPGWRQWPRLARWLDRVQVWLRVL